MSDFPGPLLDGHRSFRHDRYEPERAHYRSLAEHGQSPEVMVIACCDSRTAPETLFSAAPGTIFVARNVANLAPPYQAEGGYHGTSAALEFGVLGLKVRHIVVLGHAGCGGIQAVLQPYGQPLSEADFIGKWVDLLAPVAREVGGACHSTAAERQTAMERASIRHSIANLRTFPFVSAHEEKGRLRLHGAWFDIASGELWILNDATGVFSKAI